MYERFTDRARKVMQLANQEAQRLNHEYIGTEHILLGLIKEGSGVAANALKNLEVDLRKICLEIEKIVQSGPDTVTMSQLPQTPRAKKVIEYAIEEARALNHNYVGTEHLLLGLLREQEGVAAQVLMNLGLRLDDVREEVQNMLGQNVAQEESRGGGRTFTQTKTPALSSFGLDLTERATSGKLDPVIGRADEIERILLVLGCRSRNNPLLVGEVGVGKTALVEGLAQLAVTDYAPEVLRERRILMLDPAWLVKGITGAVNEIRRAKNVLLLLDDFHLLVGPRSSTYAGHVLKSALASGAIQCIGAITPEAYQSYVANDEVLGRYFQPIVVQPTSKEVTLAILRGVRHSYETHHRVSIGEDALHAAVELADRHLPSHCFPGKAIRLIDQAGAFLRLHHWSELEDQIEQLTRDKEQAVADQQFDKAAGLRGQADRLKKEKERRTRAWREQGEQIVGVVDAKVVAEVVRKMMGVPLEDRG
jgi:ATP-dependent Clp protease ATP-binding subunit ClpC